METILAVKFFANSLGTEPVRDWLKGLVAIDRKTIGEDIKTVQLGWPLGMPLVGHLGGGLWEVRIKLDNRSTGAVCIGWLNDGSAAWLHQEATSDSETRS